MTKHALKVTISGAQGSGKSTLAEGIVGVALELGLAVDHSQDGLFIGGSRFTDPDTPRVLIEEIQTPTALPTVQLYRSAHDDGGDGRWRWRTRCPENGNTLARSSEGYHNRGDCVAMIHRHFGPDAVIVEVGA